MQPIWKDDACLPSKMYKCNLKQFPAYVVNATEAKYVQAGVNFALENFFGLIFKGTEHDYLGR